MSHPPVPRPQNPPPTQPLHSSSASTSKSWWPRLRSASRGVVLPVTGSIAALVIFSYLNETREVPGAFEAQRVRKTRTKIDERLRGMTNGELMRTYMVYSACQVPWIVDHSPKILDVLGKVPVLSELTQFIVRHTFFAQFVGGETALGCLPVVRRLRENQIGTLFSYSVEASDGGAGGEVERPYEQRRRDAEDHVVEYIRAIVVSGDENKKWKDEMGFGEDVVGSCMVAIKMTGLISDPAILERASNTILAIRAQNASRSSYVYYPGTPANAELSLMSHSNPTTVTLPDIPDGVTAHDLSELRLLHSDLRKIMGTAREYGVRCVIDAEHSWFQVGIDALTTMLAQEYNQLPGLSPQASKTAVGSTTDTIKRWLTLNKFEKEVLVAEEKKDTYPAVQPLLYGTYQAYLRRNPAHLQESLIHAREHNYSLGVKLVRGAYHGLETSRWIAAHPDSPHLPPPVWQAKSETDDCYNLGLDVLLDEIAEDVKTQKKLAAKGGEKGVPRVAAMFGTHNPESVGMVAGGLVKRGLARPGKEKRERQAGEREGERESLWLEVGHETRKRVSVGQLYGMCDTITNSTADTFSPHGAPIVLKYLPYGALKEVMPYLGRRAIENKTVLKGEGGARAETERVKGEMKRRWLGYLHYD